MAVLKLKTEPKCKLCRHEKRDEIDEILELRSKLTRVPGTKEFLWNGPKVLAQLGEWGVDNPTEENIKVHWRKHCQIVTEGEVEQAQSVALEKFEELRDGGQHADTDENLRLIGTLWRAQTEDEIARGVMPKIPHEIMLKATAELTRRAASETQHELLTMFAHGMSEAGKALGGALGAKAIEQAENTIDVEPVSELVEVGEWQPS